MTPDEQRIAIAQACGWKGISPEYLTGYAPWRPTPYSERVMGDLDSIPLDPLPDYLNDLNACREFTAHMTYDQQVEFAEILHSIVLENPYKVWWNPTPHETFQLLDASAAQRAEAFLRTLNLWK